MPAFALAEDLARLQPENARLQKALITTLTNMKRYEQTIAQANCYLEQYGEDPAILDALKVAHFYLGKVAAVHTVALRDQKGHFGADHQNLAAVLGEVDRLGIPRVL